MTEPRARKETKGSRTLRKLTRSGSFTQQDVADLCGVTQQAVCAWIGGVALPTPERMRILKDHLGIPMEAWTEEPDAEDGGPFGSASMLVVVSEPNKGAA